MIMKLYKILAKFGKLSKLVTSLIYNYFSFCLKLWSKENKILSNYDKNGYKNR